MNPFEAGKRKVVPACLLYARSNGHVLMLHRNARGAKGRSDVHRGKWNGVGGKFELGESPLEAARREFWEEAGLRPAAAAFQPLGVLQFPNFKAAQAEDWLVYVFAVALKPRRPVRAGPFKTISEGDLHWVPAGQVLKLPLWEGDRKFIPLVLARRPFVGTFWYEQGRLKRTWLKTL